MNIATRKIFLPTIAGLILLSSLVGVVFFVMSLCYDESMFLDFKSLIRYASMLFDLSIVSGVIMICILRKSNKISVMFITLCAAILISLPPDMFIKFTNMAMKNREIRGRQVSLDYHLRDVYNTAKEYAAVHEGFLPPAQNWCDVLMDFDSNLTFQSFVHPMRPEHVIAYNENVAGLRLDAFNSNTVLFFEAKGGLNLTGSKDLIDDLDSQFADIILANGCLKTYWVKEKGIRAYGDKFWSGKWMVGNE